MLFLVVLNVLDGLQALTELCAKTILLFKDLFHSFQTHFPCYFSALPVSKIFNLSTSYFFFFFLIILPASFLAACNGAVSYALRLCVVAAMCWL